MGKSAPFGRPGASDRLRLWWQGTSTTARTNALLFIVVAAISAWLVWAGVSRDAARTRGMATASGPRVSVPSSLATVPVDLRAAGTGPAQAHVPDTTSTTTTLGTVAPSSTVPSASPPRTTSTSSAPSPATTVATNEVVFSEVPVPPGPETSVAPVPSSSVPPTTTLTSTPPPTAAPSTSAPPTTATLLPPISLPPLLGGR